MSSKGKTQAPKVTGIIEGQCPVGWIPAWDPDESGPEWYYDKSKYFQTVPNVHGEVTELRSAPPPISEDISKAVLAWYAQQYRDQAPQPPGIEQSRLDLKPSAAHRSSQPLHGAGSTNLPPERQTIDPGSHLLQIDIPGCLASNTMVKKTSLDHTSANPHGSPRRRGSSPIPVLVASSTHRHSIRSPGFEGSSPPPDKEFAALRHPIMPMTDSNDARSGLSVVGDEDIQGQRSSSSQYPVQPASNGCLRTPKVAMTDNAKSYSTANITQSTDPSSERTVSMTQTKAMRRQPTTVYGRDPEKERHMGSDSIGRASSTASSSIAAINTIHKQIPDSLDKYRNYTTRKSKMAPANARRTQSSLGGVTTTLRPAADDVLNTPIACGKRLRFMYEDSSAAGTECPTKSRRTSQTIPGGQPPNDSKILGCANSVSRLAKGAQSPNSTNGMDRIGQQPAPDPVQKGNVSISKADLVRNLVPGNTEIFSDPQDPLVQEYIDAYTHNWLRSYRQMRAMGCQTRPDRGVAVPLDMPKAPDQTQASFLRGPAFGLSQGTGSINNTGIVEYCDTAEVLDLTKPN